jgi:hypothetical protein
MVGEADEVETRVVGSAGVPEHLAHLVDAALQPEAEEDFVVRGHDAVAPGRPRCIGSCRTPVPGLTIMGYSYHEFLS